MYRQQLSLKQELIFCIQITKGRVDFNRYSADKSPCWRGVLNLRPSPQSYSQRQRRSPMFLADELRR